MRIVVRNAVLRLGVARCGEMSSAWRDMEVKFA